MSTEERAADCVDPVDPANVSLPRSDNQSEPPGSQRAPSVTEIQPDADQGQQEQVVLYDEPVLDAAIAVVDHVVESLASPHLLSATPMDPAPARSPRVRTIDPARLHQPLPSLDPGMATQSPHPRPHIARAQSSRVSQRYSTYPPPTEPPTLTRTHTRNHQSRNSMPTSPMDGVYDGRFPAMSVGNGDTRGPVRTHSTSRPIISNNVGYRVEPAPNGAPAGVYDPGPQPAGRGPRPSRWPFRTNGDARHDRDDIDVLSITSRGDGSVATRLKLTLRHANDELISSKRQKNMTSWSLNIAIGLQILLGAFTTGIAAASRGKSSGIVIAILGGLSTLAASYLARARGSGEPEASSIRCHDLENFVRELEACIVDRGTLTGAEHDNVVRGFRDRFEEIMGNHAQGVNIGGIMREFYDQSATASARNTIHQPDPPHPPANAAHRVA